MTFLAKGFEQGRIQGQAFKVRESMISMTICNDGLQRFTQDSGYHPRPGFEPGWTCREFEKVSHVSRKQSPFDDATFRMSA